MSIVLRVFLVVCAVLTLFFIFRKIRKSEFEIIDSIFWFIFVVVIALLAVFPQIAYALSALFGFESPSNFIFLSFIAILVMRVFSLNAKIASLRGRMNELVQELALREHDATAYGDK